MDAASPLVAAFGILTLKSIEAPTSLVIIVVKSAVQSGALGLKGQGRSATSVGSCTQSKKATGAAMYRNQKRQESIVHTKVRTLLSLPSERLSTCHLIG